VLLVAKKVKADIALHGNPVSELRDVTCNMGSHSVTFHPTQVNAPHLYNPSHAGWYSIYLPRRDGKLSWPSWLDSAPAGSRTSDLSITSPTPNHCTTKTTNLVSLFVCLVDLLYYIIPVMFVWNFLVEMNYWLIDWLYNDVVMCVALR